MTRPARHRLLVLTALLWLAGRPVAAQESFVDQGNQRYQAGDFAGALESYSRILDQGLESGALYYNVANAHFKLSELGPAILYYERARRLFPGDDDVAANLALARSLTADAITPLPEFWLFRVVEWWVELLPRMALIWTVALAYLAAFASLIALTLHPDGPLVPWARRVAVAGAAVTAVLGLNLVVRELDLGRSEEAVVMAEEAVVQSAPSEDPALQIFTVHEGTTVRVERRAGDWVEIVLEDGKVGWARPGQLEGI